MEEFPSYTHDIKEVVGSFDQIILDDLNIELNKSIEDPEEFEIFMNEISSQISEEDEVDKDA